MSIGGKHFLHDIMNAAGCRKGYGEGMIRSSQRLHLFFQRGIITDTDAEYIKSISMKKAAMLLQQKKFTVAEVMYMVGFSNHSYFSKCFQAEFGVTPKQYV